MDVVVFFLLDVVLFFTTELLVFERVLLDFEVLLLLAEDAVLVAGVFAVVDFADEEGVLADERRVVVETR